MEEAVDINTGADCLCFPWLILAEQRRKLVKNLVKLTAFVVEHSIVHGLLQEVNIEFPVAGTVAFFSLRPIEGDGTIRLIITVVKGLFRLQKSLWQFRELFLSFTYTKLCCQGKIGAESHFDFIAKIRKSLFVVIFQLGTYGKGKGVLFLRQCGAAGKITG